MAIKIIEHDTIEELKREARDTVDGRYQLRLNTIILAKQGVKTKDIFEKMLISKNTYYHWLHSYNDGGTEALKAIKRVGQKNGNPKYDDKIFKEVFAKLDLMEEYWSIPKMQKLVLELHNVQVPYETMRMRVKRAGYSYKSNRPSPYKGDKELQDNFKKVVSQMQSKS